MSTSSIHHRRISTRSTILWTTRPSHPIELHIVHQHVTYACAQDSAYSGDKDATVTAPQDGALAGFDDATYPHIGDAANTNAEDKAYTIVCDETYKANVQTDTGKIRRWLALLDLQLMDTRKRNTAVCLAWVSSHGSHSPESVAGAG